MADFSINTTGLEETLNHLNACRAWFHSTLEQPYTVEVMSEMIEHYWHTHISYYSNKPGQIPEKQQRIFQIESRFNADHFRRTREFNIQLAAAGNKLAALLSEIAKYEHSFQYYRQGLYFHISKSNGKGLDIVIPTITDYLKENHSPYFEFIFDDNFQFVQSNHARDFYDFFCDVHFLQFLRRTLKTLQSKNKFKNPSYNSFSDIFKTPSDFDKLVIYLQAENIIANDKTYIEVTGNKKHLAMVAEVLRIKKRLKPITNEEIARLMGEAFKMTITPDYLSKKFEGRAELVEEIRKDLLF